MFTLELADLKATRNNKLTVRHQGIARGGARQYAHANGSSAVAKIATADLRPSADGSAVRTSLVAGSG